MKPPKSPKKAYGVGPYALFFLDQLAILTRPKVWLTVPASMLIGWSIGDLLQGEFSDVSAALIVIAVVMFAINRRANLRNRAQEENRET